MTHSFRDQEITDIKIELLIDIPGFVGGYFKHQRSDSDPVMAFLEILATEQV